MRGSQEPVLKAAAQWSEMHSPWCKRRFEGWPEGIQVLCIATFATGAGVDAAIPLCKVHEQFRSFIDADNDGHGDGGVLPEPVGFGQEYLLELFDSWIDFHEQRVW